MQLEVVLEFVFAVRVFGTTIQALHPTLVHPLLLLHILLLRRGRHHR